MRGRAERLRLCILIFNPHLDMNVHHNARLTPRGREAVVRRITDDHLPAKLVAAEAGVSERTVRKWLARFRAHGSVGLRDRSSRPHKSPKQTPPAQVAVVSLCAGCACQASRSAPVRALQGDVSRILRHHALHRLALLEPPPPVHRYQRATPGELLHFDIKKLARIERPSHRVTGNRRDEVRGAGWEYVHVAIDDASRIAFARIMPDEGQHSAIKFLHAALAYFRSLGIEAKAS